MEAQLKIVTKKVTQFHTPGLYIQKQGNKNQVRYIEDFRMVPKDATIHSAFIVSDPERVSEVDRILTRQIIDSGDRYFNGNNILEAPNELGYGDLESHNKIMASTIKYIGVPLIHANLLVEYVMCEELTDIVLLETETDYSETEDDDPMWRASVRYNLAIKNDCVIASLKHKKYDTSDVIDIIKKYQEHISESIKEGKSPELTEFLKESL